MMGLPTSSEISGLSKAIRKLRDNFPEADVGRALYLSAFEECLPVAETDKHQDLRSLAVEVLVAGAPIDTIDIISIRSVNSWLLPEEIEAFLAALGIDIGSGQAPIFDPASFSLPGRPELEQLFREHILEPSAHRERYARLGAKMPNGILLYGPPGSGKSYAVKKLTSILGWPVKEINLGKMGSIYLHGTAINFEKIYEEAKQQAPAIILLEEVDTMATSRGSGIDAHRAEETNTLLRKIENASDDRDFIYRYHKSKRGIGRRFHTQGPLGPYGRGRLSELRRGSRGPRSYAARSTALQAAKSGTACRQVSQSVHGRCRVGS